MSANKKKSNKEKISTNQNSSGNLFKANQKTSSNPISKTQTFKVIKKTNHNLSNEEVRRKRPIELKRHPVEVKKNISKKSPKSTCDNNNVHNSNKDFSNNNINNLHNCDEDFPNKDINSLHKYEDSSSGLNTINKHSNLYKKLLLILLFNICAIVIHNKIAKIDKNEYENTDNKEYGAYEGGQIGNEKNSSDSSYKQKEFKDKNNLHTDIDEPNSFDVYFNDLKDVITDIKNIFTENYNKYSPFSDGENKDTLEEGNIEQKNKSKKFINKATKLLSKGKIEEALYYAEKSLIIANDKMESMEIIKKIFEKLGICETAMGEYLDKYVYKPNKSNNKNKSRLKKSNSKNKKDYSYKLLEKENPKVNKSNESKKKPLLLKRKQNPVKQRKKRIIEQLCSKYCKH